MNSHQNSSEIICDSDIHDSSIHHSLEVITNQPSYMGKIPQIPVTSNEKLHISSSEDILV